MLEVGHGTSQSSGGLKTEFDSRGRGFSQKLLLENGILRDTREYTVKPTLQA